MSRNLPDFSRPPLSEVALAVQFEPLEKIRVSHFGLYWSLIRDRFPATEEQSPINSVLEQFGPSAGEFPEVRLQMLDAPPLPRVVYLNAAGTELVQVQPDRFMHNWRKVGEGDTYPRYEHVRGEFTKELGAFQALLERERVGAIQPQQCEVTYVNQILAGEGPHAQRDLGSVLNLFRPEFSDGSRAEPEDVRIALRFVLKDERGNPCGRLYVSAQPAVRHPPDSPLLMLTLTARAYPAGKRIDDVGPCLDFCREAIVRTFALITTQEMHTHWRRNV